MLKKLLFLLKKPSIINCFCILLSFQLVTAFCLFTIEIIERWNTINYDISNISINSEEDVKKYMDSINLENPLYAHKFAYSSTWDEIKQLEGVVEIELSTLNIDNVDEFRSKLKEQTTFTFEYNTIFMNLDKLDNSDISVPFLYIDDDKMCINTYLSYGLDDNGKFIFYILEDISAVLTGEIPFYLDDWDKNLLEEIEKIPSISNIVFHHTLLPVIDPVFSPKFVKGSNFFYMNICIFAVLFFICYSILKSIFYLGLRIKEKRLVKKDLIIVAIPFFVSHFTYLRFVRNSFGFKTFDMIAVMDSHYSIWSAFIVVTVIGWVLSFIQFRKYKIKEEPNKIIEE